MPLLVLALATAAAAQGPGRRLPIPQRLSAEGLDQLFDGAAPRPAFDPEEPRRKILYSESDAPPAAPRYALDLGAVPPEFRRTIPGFEALPHKNQEETPETVDRTNALIRRYNRNRILGKIPEWTYDGRPNEPIWTCLSHAAATSNDWWALQLGRQLPTHASISHGGVERGLDPYTLELEYFARAGSDPDFVIPPKFIQKDPVRNTGFPYEPRGYAKLLTEGPFDVRDPLTGETKKFTQESSAMEGEWLQLFTNSIFRGRTPAKYAKVLAEGIDRWGIAYVQLEHTDKPRLPGAHAVAVVGFFCMEPGERLIHCSQNRTDDDWGRTAYFIAHDTFGEFPASQPRTGNSASTYRAVQIGSIDQAIVFPHGLRVTVAPKAGVPGVWTLSVTNQGGVAVPVTGLKALDSAGNDVAVLAEADGSSYLQGRAGDAVRLYVEAPHYRHRDGRGRGFEATLAASPVAAVPLDR